MPKPRLIRPLELQLDPRSCVDGGAVLQSSLLMAMRAKADQLANGNYVPLGTISDTENVKRWADFSKRSSICFNSGNGPKFDEASKALSCTASNSRLLFQSTTHNHFNEFNEDSGGDGWEFLISASLASATPSSDLTLMQSRGSNTNRGLLIRWVKTGSTYGLGADNVLWFQFEKSDGSDGFSLYHEWTTRDTNQHFWRLSFDGISTVSLYFDGDFVTSASVSLGAGNHTYGMYIGVDPTGFAPDWSGKIYGIVFDGTAVWSDEQYITYKDWILQLT